MQKICNVMSFESQANIYVLCICLFCLVNTKNNSKLCCFFDFQWNLLPQVATITMNKMHNIHMSWNLYWQCNRSIAHVKNEVLFIIQPLSGIPIRIITFIEGKRGVSSPIYIYILAKNKIAFFLFFSFHFSN